MALNILFRFSNNAGSDEKMPYGQLTVSQECSGDHSVLAVYHYCSKIFKLESTRISDGICINQP
jgi:hypothetical protein